MANRIFSGMRPSGKLHLGNYLGALKQWVKLQDDAELAIFACVDYHGITTPFDPKTYHQQVMDVVLDYLAAGVDPNKALLMRQSKVPQHTELAWIFNTLTPVSWLDRLPTYQEQLEKTGANNMGLLDYPVLMASDILIYKPNMVPVGEDQQPHIDLTNEIARRFNTNFGEVFPAVKSFMAPAKRIMSLQDPTKKMSKTPHKSQGDLAGQAGNDGCIFLVDTPEDIRGKIKKATTDSGKEIRFEPKEKPALSNLLTIFSEVSAKSISELEKEYNGKSYVDFKTDLAEAVIEFLKPFQERRQKFADDMDKVEKILETGEQKACELAGTTLAEVKEKMGL